MQIKELIIKNFKSFDFVKIPFDKGLHVIVGPNGSGKSNIVDAILFVFGTTSTKKLRVEKLSNLINHNSKTKTARVRCVIDNDGEEITITRELDKEGKSTFLLNDKRKALNEIVSYLNGLGFIINDYNTVQQGDVMKIINLSSEERREVIDDISGIALFDAKKKESEMNLKKVQERLDKINIALNERKPYVEQLRSEKDNALKYKELEKQEQNLTYNLYTKQIKYYNQEIDQQVSEIENKKQVVNNYISEKSKSEQRLIELNANLEKVNSELISHSEKVQLTVGKQYSELNANKEIVLNNLNLNKNNLDYLISENKNTSESLNISKKQSSDLELLITKITNDLNSKKELQKELKVKLDSNQKEFDKIKELQKELYSQICDFNETISSKQDRFFEIKSKINTYEMQKEALELKDKEAFEKSNNLSEKRKELESEISFLEKEFSKVTKDLEAKEKELTRLKESKEKISEDINKNNIKLIGLNKDYSISQNILSKKKDIKESLSKFKTFKGFLDDLVSLDDSEKAYYSTYVVLTDDSEIKSISKKINFNLSYVVLSVLGTSEKQLSKFIKSKNTNKKILDDFYFDGFCYKKLAFKDTKKLEKEISKLTSEKESLLSNLNEVSENINNLTIEISDLKNKLNDLSVKLNTSKSIQKDVISEVNIISEKQSNVVNIKTITSNILELRKELEKLEKEININNSKKTELESELNKINIDEQNNLRDKYDNLVSEINSYEQSLILKNSELKILNEKIEGKSKYIESNNLKIEELNKKIKELEDKKTELNNKLIEINKEIEKQDEYKNKLYQKKQETNSEITNISQNLHRFDSEINSLNMTLNNLNIMLSTNQSKILQLEQNLKFIEISEDNKNETELTIEEINSRLRKIKREKNYLGNINFNAIDSYDKLAKEYDVILHKCDILEQERKEVMSLLSEINIKKKTVFLDSFNKINSEFKKIIKNMSKLLSGELVLEGEDVLKSKLLINLTKNGKTKELDIMSGGEKAITALAFIFAMYAYKNTPFYVLDEIDASLDEYNLNSVLNYLKDLSKTTTIFAISHNSAFVSGANKIIGVTLKENTSVIGLDLK